MPDSAAALSVLVLAWDEAAPTVRTVVEAAPALGSLLVLLPPALPTPPTPEPPAPAADLPTAPAPPELTLLAAQPPAQVAATTASEARPALALPSLPAPGPGAAVAATAALPRPAAVVRQLRLVASALPATVRSGTFQVPAAPYLGATAGPVPPPGPALQTPGSSLPNARPAILAPPAPPAGQSPPPAPAAAEQAPAEAAGLAEAAAPGVLVPAVSANPAPALAATPAPAPPLAEAAFAADEILDPNPEEELRPADPPRLPAAPATGPARLRDQVSAGAFSLGPFGNRLPQFDTSPVLPARPAPPAVEDAPEEEDASAFAASVAAARQYTAPDLNSQVIRYARLAVPLALAGGAHEVIYAPAWPTWLAALELRQRSQGPLVLHLPALAAGRQPADTAAGWPAELQRQALRQADLVLVETYALARRLRRELGLGPSAVRVVRTADTAAIARALRRARRRPGLA